MQAAGKHNNLSSGRRSLDQAPYGANVALGHRAAADEDGPGLFHCSKRQCSDCHEDSIVAALPSWRLAEALPLTPTASNLRVRGGPDEHARKHLTDPARVGPCQTPPPHLYVENPAFEESVFVSARRKAARAASSRVTRQGGEDSHPTWDGAPKHGSDSGLVGGSEHGQARKHAAPAPLAAHSTRGVLTAATAGERVTGEGGRDTQHVEQCATAECCGVDSCSSGRLAQQLRFLRDDARFACPGGPKHPNRVVLWEQ
ncbi:unnamed protein product [Pedinophyceae sp. YPF-701]|nr:unnamed protein product [Pedinophyceae sp. YPF-701]